MALVPNTTNFTLQDVVNVINPTTPDMVDCVADAIAGYYDATYAANVGLLKFRNYGYKGGGTLSSNYANLSWSWDRVACTSGTITITSSGSWTASLSNGDVFSLAPTTGNNGGTITIDLYSNNVTAYDISEVITIVLDADPLQRTYVYIVQAPYLGDCE